MKFSIYFCLILTFGQLQKNVTVCPFRWVVKKIHNESFFFYIWVFFHEHSWFTWQQGKGEGIHLTPHYHFHPLHSHLEISWVIVVESSPLHLANIVAQLWPGTSGFRAPVANHWATHPSDWSFKDNICSVRMLCVMVWFHGFHLQKQPPEVFLKLQQIHRKTTVLETLFLLFFSSLWRNIVEINGWNRTSINRLL